MNKYYNGSTYVPFKTAISFQEDTRDKTVSVIQLDENNRNGVTVKYRRYIPLHIYPCQKLTTFGAQVAVIPQYYGKIENRLIWQLSSILTQVEPIWQHFLKSIRTSEDWFGWLLVYLTKNCFPSQQRQAKKDPFKFTYISNIENIQSKLPPSHNLEELLNTVPKISTLSVSFLDEQHVLNSIYEKDSPQPISVVFDRFLYSD